MLLKGKRIIVTAGASGIGKATVLACAREGAAVVSMSRAEPTSERVVRILEEARMLGPGPIAHMQLDVTNQEQVNEVFAKAVALMGGLDVLVASAGQEVDGPAEDVTSDDLFLMFDVNLRGTAFTNVAAFRYMKDTGGSIINFTSYTAENGLIGGAAYGASKGGVTSYSKVVAKEWGKYGIRVNVSLPVVSTELAEQWFSQMSPEEKARNDATFAATIPLGGKLGRVEDAANLNVFLASDMSRFITGHVIGVDGGMSMG